MRDNVVPNPYDPDKPSDDGKYESYRKKKGLKRIVLRDNPIASLTHDELPPDLIMQSRLIKATHQLDKDNLTKEDINKFNEEIADLGHRYVEGQKQSNHIKILENIENGEKIGVMRGTVMPKDGNPRDIKRAIEDWAENITKLDVAKTGISSVRTSKVYKEARDVIDSVGGVDRMTGYSKGGGFSMYLGKDLNVPTDVFNPALGGKQALAEFGLGQDKLNMRVVRTNTDPASSAIDTKHRTNMWDSVDLVSVAPLEKLQEGRGQWGRTMGEHALENFTDNGKRMKKLKRTKLLDEALNARKRGDIYKHMRRIEDVGYPQWEQETTYKLKTWDSPAHHAAEHASGDQREYERGELDFNNFKDNELNENVHDRLKDNYERLYGSRPKEDTIKRPEGFSEEDYQRYKEDPASYEENIKNLGKQAFIENEPHINARRGSYATFGETPSLSKVGSETTKALGYGALGEAGTDFLRGIDPHMFDYKGGDQVAMATSAGIAGLAAGGLGAVPEFAAGAFAAEGADIALESGTKKLLHKVGLHGKGVDTVAGGVGAAGAGSAAAVGANITRMGLSNLSSLFTAGGSEAASASALAGMEGIELTEAGATATEGGAVAEGVATGAEVASAGAEAAEGAELGGEIGTVIGPEGTLVGAGIGAAVGGAIYGIDKLTGGGITKGFEYAGQEAEKLGKDVAKGASSAWNWLKHPKHWF
jgi:hypothetical protein